MRKAMRLALQIPFLWDYRHSESTRHCCYLSCAPLYGCRLPPLPPLPLLLPPPFQNMTKLRLLALNNNRLHFVANGAFSELHDLDEIWLRNNKLVYIPRGLPDNLRKLYMDSNRIRIIEDGLFPNTSHLDYLTVENNQINRIQNRTFLGLRFLKSLNFRGNELRVIEAGTFDSLRNLSTLSLSDNPLERVEADAFRDLQNLTFLHLDMCGEQMSLEQNFLPQMPRLQQLSMMNSPGLGKAFVQMLADAPMAPVKGLAEIDLTYNDLRTLDPNVRELFPALKALALDGNSWLCDRRLAWLREWMVTSDVSFSKYEPVTCEHPYSLRGREIRATWTRTSSRRWPLPRRRPVPKTTSG